MYHMNEDLSEATGGASDAIAIVGMSGRFPGARSIAAFWENQRQGIVSISRFSEGELEDSFDPATRNDPAFVRARACSRMSACSMRASLACTRVRRR
jgi:hypothetical protein